MSAYVLLGDDVVGYLSVEGNTVAFRFDADYLNRPNRPVLGQAFEDRRLTSEDVFVGSRVSPLPTFFRNALPEGALRKVVEARLTRTRLLELDMLLRLGPDLPGALRVLPDPLATGKELPALEHSDAISVGTPADPIRFSLSGVQLKASVDVDVADENKISLPLVGEGGRWIAKFPSPAFRDLPENEFLMLKWARALGLNVPNHRLVEVEAIQNLPSEFVRHGRALLVERFDRPRGEARIHQEDFAQVFEVEPEEKDVLFVPPDITMTYTGIGAIVMALAGNDDFFEYARRVAFMVLSGNADAHAKNWSLIYPDRVHARLSPLYDTVCTIAYRNLHRTLALGFVPPANPSESMPATLSAVTYHDFRVLAEHAGESPLAVEDELRTFVKLARLLWNDIRPDAPQFVADALSTHLEEISLSD